MIIRSKILGREFTCDPKDAAETLHSILELEKATMAETASTVENDVNKEKAVLEEQLTAIQEKLQDLYDEYDALREKISDAEEEEYSLMEKLGKFEDKPQDEDKEIVKLVAEVIKEADKFIQGLW